MDIAKRNNKSEVVTYLQNWINLPSEEKQNQIQKYRLKLQDNHPPSNQQQQQNAEEEEEEEEEEKEEKEEEEDKQQIYSDADINQITKDQSCELGRIK